MGDATATPRPPSWARSTSTSTSSTCSSCCSSCSATASKLRTRIVRAKGPASAGPFAFGPRSSNFARLSRPRARMMQPTLRPATPADIRRHHRHLPPGGARRVRPASSWSRRTRLRCCAASRPSPTLAIPISSPSSTAASSAMPTPMPIAPVPAIASRWRIPSTSPPDAQGKGIGRVLLAALIEACTAKGFRLMVAVIGDSAQFRLHHPASPRRLHVLRHHPLGRLQVRPLARQRHHGVAAGRRRQLGSAVGPQWATSAVGTAAHTVR